MSLKEEDFEEVDSEEDVEDEEDLDDWWGFG
jgi:hypothetical protein